MIESWEISVALNKWPKSAQGQSVFVQVPEDKVHEVMHGICGRGKLLAVDNLAELLTVKPPNVTVKFSQYIKIFKVGDE